MPLPGGVFSTQHPVGGTNSKVGGAYIALTIAAGQSVLIQCNGCYSILHCTLEEGRTIRYCQLALYALTVSLRLRRA